MEKDSKSLNQRDLATPEEAAAILRVHRMTVIRAIHRGEIKNYGLGTSYRVDLNELNNR